MLNALMARLSPFSVSSPAGSASTSASTAGVNFQVNEDLAGRSLRAELTCPISSDQF